MKFFLTLIKKPKPYKIKFNKNSIIKIKKYQVNYIIINHN